MSIVSQLDEVSTLAGAPRPVATFLPDPEPEELWCPINSVDDHSLEPPDLFISRVPAALRDRVPTVVSDDEGVPYWLVEGHRFAITAGNGAVCRPHSEWIPGAAQKFEELRRGVWDPKERLKDMDLIGVYASLNFPSLIFGFAGWRFSRMQDQDVGLACFRAYNDWVIDEWCAADHARYIPCQITWLSDPDIAASEIRRNAERGFRSLSFSENPEGLGFPSIFSDYWDPVMRACADTGTVINLHVGSSGRVTVRAEMPNGGAALFPLSGWFALVDWIYSGVPARYRELKIVLSEAGISWLPAAFERLMRDQRLREQLGEPDPVDIAHRNFWYTSIEDPAGFRMLDLIGEDKVMMESDYPHFDTSWPDTQKMAREYLEHLPVSTIKKVCYENAAAVYGHPLPPQEWISRSVVGQQ